MPVSVSYTRGPFFLKGTKEDIDQWYANMGLPNDAPRSKVAQLKGWYGPNGQDAHTDILYKEAGLSPRNREGTESKVWTETLTAHRLAHYASSVSQEKGEIVWTALSRRFFEGKDTAVRPIRLDSMPMLLECAELAGLDRDETQKVLESDAFAQECLDAIDDVHAHGIHAIPYFVIDAKAKAKGNWLKTGPGPYREMHSGSGNKDIFKNKLKRVRAAAMQ